MDEPRDPLTRLDRIILAAMAGYGLIAALGSLWLLYHGACWLYSLPHGDSICGSVVVLAIAVVAVASKERP